MSAERVATTVRLRRDLLDRIDAQAKRRVVGRNLIITAAVEELLDRLEADDV